MGGSRGGRAGQIRNIFIIFAVSGLWHGANWTFVAWGLLHACFFLPLMLGGVNRRHLGVVAEGRLLPGAKELAQMGMTFLLTTIAWVFFRSETIASALAYLSTMFSRSAFAMPEVECGRVVMAILFLVGVEWLRRGRQHALEFDAGRVPGVARYGIYYALVFAVLYFGGKQQDFIYFQF